MTDFQKVYGETFETVVKRIEEAGYSWCIEGRPGGYYEAIVAPGDQLHALSTRLRYQTGRTAAEALNAAFLARVANVNPSRNQ